MADTEKLEIACYLSWCGAEVTFPFTTRQEYDAARAFLDKLAVLHKDGSEIPSGYARSVKDFYFLEEQHRDAFQAFMRNPNTA